jgi:hypothetical protein
MSTAFKCDKCGQFKVGPPPKAFTFGALFQVQPLFAWNLKDYCVTCLLKIIIEGATAELERLKAGK